jgi:hypothetical protein
MKQLLGGLLLGAALGAGGVWAAQSWLASPPADCAGMCGEGTACEQGRCLVLADASEPELETEAEAESKAKSRRGRRGRRARGDAAAPATGKGPPVDDDSRVPRFDAKADQTIGAADGSERLSDGVVDRELAKLDKTFQGCVRAANERVDELGVGKVEYEFGIAGSGKVTGVSARAPKNLSDAGLVPCVRKAVYGHKFPSFDGPQMRVSSSFTVG